MSHLRARPFLVTVLMLGGILATTSWLLPEDSGSTALASPAGIQGPGDSQLWIQNLDPNQPATLVADFFNQRGGSPVSIVPAALPAGASTQLALRDEPALQFGAYAAIVNSDREIGTISRSEWPISGGAIMYGSHEPSTELLLPGVVKGHAGENSLISIQNTDSSQQATVSLALQREDGVTEVESTFLVGPGTSITMDIAKTAEHAGLPDGFSGWGRVLTDGTPVVVSHIVDIETSERGTYATSGWITEADAERLHAPMVQAAAPIDPGNPGSTPIDSEIVVLAPGSDPVELSLRYTGVSGSCAGQQYQEGPLSIDAGHQIRVSQSPAAGPLPAGCLASATLEAAGGPIVATVIARSSDASPLAQAYDALPTDRGAERVHLPHVLDRVGTAVRQSTAIQVMNLGDAEANLRIDFTDASGSAHSCGADCTATLAAEGGMLWWPPALSDLPEGTYGHALVSGDQPLAVVVSEISENSSLDLASYTGIPATGGGAPRPRTHMPLLVNGSESTAATPTLPPTATGGAPTATPALPSTPTPALPSTATPALPSTPTAMPTATDTPMPGPTDTPIPMPTSTPGLPSTATPILPPTATATMAAGSGVSDAARERVPPAVLAAALADPSKIAGHGLPANPNLPPGPNNPPRNCLSLVDPGKPYHPLFNSLIFKAGCP